MFHFSGCKSKRGAIKEIDKEDILVYQLQNNKICLPGIQKTLQKVFWQKISLCRGREYLSSSTYIFMSAAMPFFIPFLFTNPELASIKYIESLLLPYVSQ